MRTRSRHRLPNCQRAVYEVQQGLRPQKQDKPMNRKAAKLSWYVKVLDHTILSPDSKGKNRHVFAPVPRPRAVSRSALVAAPGVLYAEPFAGNEDDR